MKKITEKFEYQLEIKHEGEFWVLSEARRYIKDAKKTVLKVDIPKEEGLRSVLELDDSNRIAPDEFRGLTLKAFLSNDFWAGSGVLDETPGSEIVDISIEYSETKDQTYKSVDIDFKYSLWSSEESWFEDMADTEDALLLMKAAFDGSGNPVCVRTAPKKEIRFGSVWIERNEMSYAFRSEWDDSCDLVPDSNLNDAQRVELEGSISEWCQVLKDGYELDFFIEDNVGAYTRGVVQCEDFKSALEQVDAAEDHLIEMEAENSEALSEYILDCMSG